LFLFHVLEVIKIEEKGKHPNTWDNSIYIRWVKMITHEWHTYWSP
jgi:hypothetical protein